MLSNTSKCSNICQQLRNEFIRNDNIEVSDLINIDFNELMINEFNKIVITKIQSFYDNKPKYNGYVLIDKIKNTFLTVSEVEKIVKYIGLLYVNMIKLFKLNDDEIKEFNKIFNKVNNIQCFIYMLRELKTMSKDRFKNEIVNYYNRFKYQYMKLINEIEDFKAKNNNEGITFEYADDYTGFNKLSLSASQFATVSAIDLNDIELNEDVKILLYSFIIGLINEININSGACLGLWFSDGVLYADISIINVFDEFAMCYFTKDNNDIDNFEYSNKHIDLIIKRFKYNNKYFNQLDSGILINNDNCKYKIQYISHDNLIEFIKPIFNQFKENHIIYELNEDKYKMINSNIDFAFTFKDKYEITSDILIKFDEVHKTLINYFNDNYKFEDEKNNILKNIEYLINVFNRNKFILINIFKAYNTELDYEIYNEDNFKYYMMILYLLINVFDCNNFAYIPIDKTATEKHILEFIKYLKMYHSGEYNNEILNNLSNILYNDIYMNIDINEYYNIQQLYKKLYGEILRKIYFN